MTEEFAKVDNGTVVAYPLRRRDLRSPSVSLPGGVTLTAEMLAYVGAVRVSRLPEPATADDEVATRDAQPTKQPDGTWALGWTVAKKSSSAIRGQIDVEARRRVGAGFSVERRGQVYTFDSDPYSREEIRELAAQASGWIAAGGGPTASDWLSGGGADVETTDGQVFSLNPRQAVALGEALARHVQAHRAAARVLRSLDPIPSDFRDDTYWP